MRVAPPPHLPPPAWAAIASALIAFGSFQPTHLAIAAAPVFDRVARVVDGDTVITEAAGRVRLIGVNTPETLAPAQRQGAPPQCYGPEASAEMKRLLPAGTAVRLETDAEAEDKYGRRLVYLYREPDDTFVNAALVQKGFARARSYKPNTKYDALLRSYQEEAQKARRGLWGACEAPPPPRESLPPPPLRESSPPPPLRESGPPPLLREGSPPPPLRESKPPGGAQLADPGDTKNCADFATYGEAKAWYDKYYGLFGDVAKLDRDGDGIPCESLLTKERRAASS